MRMRAHRCAGCDAGHLALGVACVRCSPTWSYILLTLTLLLWPHMAVWVGQRAGSLRHTIVAAQTVALIGGLPGFWGGGGAVGEVLNYVLGALRLLLQDPALTVWSCDRLLTPSATVRLRAGVGVGARVGAGAGARVGLGLGCPSTSPSPVTPVASVWPLTD